MVQIKTNQIFDLPEIVDLLVITSSEKGTLEFSLHYIKVVITQREGRPADNTVERGVLPTKEKELE